MKALRSPAGRAAWVDASPLLSLAPHSLSWFPCSALKAQGTARSAVFGQAPPIMFQLRPSALVKSVTWGSIYQLKGLQTPPLQGVVPIPTTKNHPRGPVVGASSRSWLFGCKLVLPWSRSSLGPQQCPCQPSSRGGAPIITEGSEHVLESRSGGN